MGIPPRLSRGAGLKPKRKPVELFVTFGSARRKPGFLKRLQVDRGAAQGAVKRLKKIEKHGDENFATLAGYSNEDFLNTSPDPRYSLTVATASKGSFSVISSICNSTAASMRTTVFSGALLHNRRQPKKKGLSSGAKLNRCELCRRWRGLMLE